MEQNSHTYANGYNQKNVTYIIPDTALLCPVTTSGSIASRRLDGNDINDPFDENSIRPTDQYGDDTGTSIGRRRRLLVNADTAFASGENVNEFGAFYDVESYTLYYEKEYEPSVWVLSVLSSYLMVFIGRDRLIFMPLLSFS